MGVICFEWYVSAWLWVLFLFFGALLGFGYEYLESYTDNYPRLFGAFSFETPWSLWEAAATLCWISATSKPANLYLFIAASEHFTPSLRSKSPVVWLFLWTPLCTCASVCESACLSGVCAFGLLMCNVITARLYKQLNPASYVPALVLDQLIFVEKFFFWYFKQPVFHPLK